MKDKKIVLVFLIVCSFLIPACHKQKVGSIVKSIAREEMARKGYNLKTPSAGNRALEGCV